MQITKKNSKFDIKKLKRLPEKNLEEVRRIFGNLKRYLQDTKNMVELEYMREIRRKLKVKK